MAFLKKHSGKFIFFILGLLLGLFISRLPIEFEEKTSWTSLASLVLTVMLALYVEFIVRPSITNNRNERDILIDQLKDIKVNVGEVHSYYNDVRNQNPLPEDIKSTIKTKFRELSNLIDLLKQTDIYCENTKHHKVSEKVFAIYLKYKRSVTGRQFDKPSFFFDRLYFKDQEKAHKELLKTIMHSIIDINKA